jgi:hypothetical protein
MILFGVNEKHWPDVSPYVSPMTIERSYKGLTDTWPVMQVNPLQPSLWSPRPDPVELLKGTYDATFESALKTAPPGSLLTVWHEADKGPASPSGGLTAEMAREVHAYMHALVHRFGSTIPYGSVSTGGQGTGSWTVKGLDFYGTDMYDFGGWDHPAWLLNRWSATQPPGPRVIAETNSNHPSHRPWWFMRSYDWLLANDGIAMMTFWNPTGPLSGRWLPDDEATISTLRQIAAEAAA